MGDNEGKSQSSRLVRRSVRTPALGAARTVAWIGPAIRRSPKVLHARHRTRTRAVWIHPIRWHDAAEAQLVLDMTSTQLTEELEDLGFYGDENKWALPLEGPLNQLIWAEPALETGGAFAGMPLEVLVQILTGYSSDNLVVHTTVIAQVHPQWWRIMRSTGAYGVDVSLRRDCMRHVVSAFNCRQRPARDGSALAALIQPSVDRWHRGSQSGGRQCIRAVYPRFFNVGILHASGQAREQGVAIDSGYGYNGTGSHFIPRLTEAVALVLGAALRARGAPLQSLPQPLIGPARQ